MFVRHIRFYNTGAFINVKGFFKIILELTWVLAAVAEAEPLVDVGTVIVLPGGNGDNRYSSPATFTRAQEQP